LWGKG